MVRLRHRKGLRGTASRGRLKTHPNLANALKGDARRHIIDLTAEALAEAGLDVGDASRHLDLDSEEACEREHGGDWQRRLRTKPTRH